MRQNLDEAGGEHVKIWFNEGDYRTHTAYGTQLLWPLGVTPASWC